MARARMITNAITRDKRINDLSDDTSRLAFTWLITFADAEGRTHGDPAVIRSMLFPRRTDISIKQMESYILEWAVIGLVMWYEADGDLWIHFPAFDKNQPGLRKDREAHSEIPDPACGTIPELLRSKSGVSPEQLPVKLKEVKLNKVNGSSPSGDGRYPESSKSEFITAMEHLESTFAEARGSPLPDWVKDPKGSNKRWRTPLGQIYTRCGKDKDQAARLIKQVVTRMMREGLTFDAPDQILKTSLSVIIDQDRPSSNAIAAETY